MDSPTPSGREEVISLGGPEDKSPMDVDLHDRVADLNEWLGTDDETEDGVTQLMDSPKKPRGNEERGKYLLCRKIQN